jgi:hypothetical protein
LSRLSRRAFLGGAAAIAAAAALRPRLASGASASRRPRFLIQIQLRGGIDAILSTNPKRRAELEPAIDLPYGEQDIITVGQTRVGPLFKSIAAHVPKMAILNNVNGSTVAHETGDVQIQQMRRAFAADSGGLSGTIGALYTPERPIAEVRFSGTYQLVQPHWRPPTGRALVVNYAAPTEPSRTFISELAELAQDTKRRGAVLAALAAEIGRCPEAERSPLQATHDLLKRLQTAPAPPAPPPFVVPPSDYKRALSIANGKVWPALVRDVLFLLEQELCSSCFLFAPFSQWDTHGENIAGQYGSMGVLAPGLNQLLDGLAQRRTRDGRTLAEQTVVLVSSELGRFPLKNRFDGKDHFPEFPIVLVGPGIRPGQYGETDKRMVGQPLAAQTGRPSSSKRDFVPTIDDVGATLLQLFGVEDTMSLGYTGRRLDFLLA